MDVLKRNFYLRVVVLAAAAVAAATVVVFSFTSCSEATKTSSKSVWVNGHPPADSQTKCATCHLSKRPTSTVTGVKTTANGRNYTIHFHNLVPTGFNEDPGLINDCSTCHSHDAGWSAGQFRIFGGGHLTDSLKNPVSRCLDCHDYPADFWRSEHSMAQTKMYDCIVCHLLPSQVGGTWLGGFGDSM
jgi:hypothetical protein